MIGDTSMTVKQWGSLSVSFRSGELAGRLTEYDKTQSGVSLYAKEQLRAFYALMDEGVSDLEVRFLDPIVEGAVALFEEDAKHKQALRAMVDAAPLKARYQIQALLTSVEDSGIWPFSSAVSVSEAHAWAGHLNVTQALAVYDLILRG